MTDSRSELIDAAHMFEVGGFVPSPAGRDGRRFILTLREREIIARGLRLAASQPNRDAVARATTQAALTALRAGGDNLAIFNAVNESLTLLLVGGDQKTTQITKPTSSRTEATATETVLIPGDAGGAV